MFACVWMMFSTKDRHVYLCVDGVQHQGQACLPVCGWCSAPRTAMFACVLMVYGPKDRHVYLCVDGVQHQGQACLPVCGCRQSLVCYTGKLRRRNTPWRTTANDELEASSSRLWLYNTPPSCPQLSATDLGPVYSTVANQTRELQSAAAVQHAPLCPQLSATDLTMRDKRCHFGVRPPVYATVANQSVRLSQTCSTEVFRPKAMSDTHQPLGGYGPSVFFNDAERAFASCLMLRGQAEARLLESFPCYRPFDYTVAEGTTYNIRVEVSQPPPDLMPAMIEMDVYWGSSPAIPELTNAVYKPEERQKTPRDTFGRCKPWQFFGMFFEIDRAYSSCLGLRGQLEKLMSKSFPNYKPISYQAQVVAGMNYKIRVDVSEPWGKWPAGGGIGPVRLRNIVEMTVYWPPDEGTPELIMKDVKIKNEPLEYFENEGEGRRKKALGGGGYGETVFFNREPETERAYLSSFALRGQVEEKLNKGKPFPSYKPFSYQAEMLWLEGMNFKILIDITPPPNWPPGIGIGLVIPQTFVEITVYLGPIPIPELKDAKILQRA
ncbi:hypothetical protein Bbelb_351670 [Branchiostoma belcheri]|nr:hypothetical protein Bbelb_351670 [Branchiostoma belcheri]